VSFEFAAPTRIIFGEGRLGEAVKLAAGMGSRVLVVEGASGRAEPLVCQLREQRLATTTLRVASEPTVSLVEQGAALARREQCDRRAPHERRTGSRLPRGHREGPSSHASGGTVHRHPHDRRHRRRGDAERRPDG
jgi:hypothetical protein